MGDLRDQIFRNLTGKKAKALILANEPGVIAGTDRARRDAEGLGLTIKKILEEGSLVQRGEVIAELQGEVKQVIMGEDCLVGDLGKPSGIATAAYNFVKAAGGKPKIVSGAWKKMPIELKETVRRAIKAGQASIRISEHPFVYLDKNYLEVLGGIEKSLEAVADLKGCLKVVQLKGKHHPVEQEAEEAAQAGADIIFIDTGKMSDLERVVEKIQNMGRRDKLRIAFGGGVKLEEIPRLKTLDVDILDIGRAIIDAPLLDLKYEVISIQ